MPKVICLDEDAKDSIIEGLKDLSVSKDGIQFIKDIKKCKTKSKRKRKPSAYNVYVKECMNDSSGDGAVKDRFKRCATSWKGLSDSEKQKYQDQADRL